MKTSWPKFAALNKLIALNKPLAAAILAGLALFGYGGYRHYRLAKELAATRKNFTVQIGELKTNLASTTAENTRLAGNLTAAEAENADLKKELKKTTKKADKLEKLTRIDPELLQKYSKIFFLNEHYTPAKLTDIPADRLYNGEKTQQLQTDIWSQLEDLLNDATEDGLTLKIVSAYRSFGAQATLKTGYRVTYGAGTANQFSAEQGYSEHQLGTTVDFTTPAVGGLSLNFKNSEAYNWLLANAHRYGFIVSYPESNAYYQFEPWHWRFVGVRLARRLYRDKKYFYDLDQREIDKYLINFFD